MSINSEINKMKEDLTEEDIAKMKRDFALHKTIMDTYDNNRDLIKFLLLFTVQYMNNANIDIDEFISDLKKGDTTYKALSSRYKKESGH